MLLPRCLATGHSPSLLREVCSPAGPPVTSLSSLSPSGPQLAQILPTEENFLLCFRQHVGSSAEFMEVRLRRGPPGAQSQAHQHAWERSHPFSSSEWSAGPHRQHPRHHGALVRSPESEPTGSQEPHLVCVH